MHWSPDGSRVLFERVGSFTNEGPTGQTTEAGLEDGSFRLRLLGEPLRPSPLGTAATFDHFFNFQDDPRPTTCLGGRQSDVLTLATLQNLTTDLSIVRLPANNGFVIRGTVADLNLDHYQIEYADAGDPDTWRPLGPASEVPVVDDLLTAWVPPSPGTFLVRLRAVDRAGNVRTKVRSVAWDRVPSLANITKTEALISPNGDGRKDSVAFNYLVVEPARVLVRIAGPEAPNTPSMPTVRALALDYPTTGPASFTWDGRDGVGQLVRDGRYTVFINDLPFRLEVDVTPPEVAWAYENLRPEGRGVLAAERVWRIVDARLKGWSAGTYRGATQVYEPVRNADGEIVYDRDIPRPVLVGGRPVSRRDRRTTLHSAEEILEFATEAGNVLTAEDYAGNRVATPVLPLPERLFNNTVSFEVPRANTEDLDIKDQVSYFLPPFSEAYGFPTRYPEFTRIETLPGMPGVGLQLRPAEGGPWRDVPFPNEPMDPLPSTAQRGRLAATTSTGGQVFSEEFAINPCLTMTILAPRDGSPDPGDYVITVQGGAAEPLSSATLKVRGELGLAGFRSSATSRAPLPSTRP